MSSGLYTNRSNASNSLKKYSISDRDILFQRIKRNMKYENVQPKTDSGYNTRRKQELIREINKYYKVKHNEVFCRISLPDLLQLMVAYAQECGISKADNLQNSCDKEHEKSEVAIKYRDEVEDILHKMDQFEIERKCVVKPPASPYLIIDVRTAEQYTEEHLITATCHPSCRLSRAVNWESSEMLEHKNHQNSIIVVYDFSEDLAPEVATTLVHRGYENVYLLSGGLKLVKDKFGKCLLTTGANRQMSPEIADIVTNQLSLVIFPPLSLSKSAEWWSAVTDLANKTKEDEERILTTSSKCTGDNSGRHPWR